MLEQKDLELISKIVGQEISSAIKTALYPINKKLDDLEIGLDTMRLEHKISNRDIRQDIHMLNDQVDTLIGVLEAHKLLPKAEHPKQF